MKASELIAAMQSLIDTHGDCDVVVFDKDWSCYRRLLGVSHRGADREGDEFSDDDKSLGDMFIAIA